MTAGCWIAVEVGSGLGVQVGSGVVVGTGVTVAVADGDNVGAGLGVAVTMLVRGLAWRKNPWEQACSQRWVPVSVLAQGSLSLA